MTKLEELYEAWEASNHAVTEADEAEAAAKDAAEAAAAASDDAWANNHIAFVAYKAELKKTQEETSDD